MVNDNPQCLKQRHALRDAQEIYRSHDGQVVYLRCLCGLPRMLAVDTWEREVAARATRDAVTTNSARIAP
jgi:hypothetical protein